MSATLAQSQDGVPASLSRYRSVRKAHAAETHAAPPPPIPSIPSQHVNSQDQQQNIQRSMSRYKHHKAPPVPRSKVPPTPPVPAMPKVIPQPAATLVVPTPIKTLQAKTSSSSLKKSPGHSPVEPPNLGHFRQAVRSRSNSPSPALRQKTSATDLKGNRKVHEATSIQLEQSPYKVPSAPNLRSANVPSRSKSSRYRHQPPESQPVPHFPGDRTEQARLEARQLMESEDARYRKMQAALKAKNDAAELAVKEEKDRVDRAQKLQEDIEKANARRKQVEARRRREQTQRPTDRPPASVPVPEQPQDSPQKAITRTNTDATTADSVQSPSKLGGIFRRRKATDATLPPPAVESRKDQNPPVPASRPNPPRIRKGDGPPVSSAEAQTGVASQGIAIDENGQFRGLLAGAPENVTAVPGADAPVSASNAGERRVTIECNKSRINLPVTPSTTPIDLIRSSSIVMSENIDPHASVLLESFSKVGVQRPLRTYEHIRDVMNSWDEDKQNSLILGPSATGGNDPDLKTDGVPSLQPGPVSFYLQYSQKPGKWEKRWVTVRQDGQITQAKKEDSPAKDIVNVCHLSDFDIYTPQAKAAARKIKPPKKHCFAIKSQQKSAMFLSLDNFVHFFSTNDKQVAGIFYTTVQSWRSWYLTHVLGEGSTHKPVTNGTSAPTKSSGGGGLTLDLPAAEPDRTSIYQLGSFKPFLDLETFSTPAPAPTPLVAHAHSRSRSGTAHARQPSKADPKPSAAARDRTVSAASTTKPLSSSSSHSEGTAFAPGGLLGRSYSARQKAQREREAADRLAADAASPFTGAGLISALGKHDRGTSVEEKGRGFVPPDGLEGGLVGAATTPAIAAGAGTAPGRSSADERRRSARYRSGVRASWHEAIAEEQGAGEVFAADGLLAGAGGGGVGARETGPGHGRGRGVAWDTAKGPMVDLRGERMFTGGSLLGALEGDGMPRVGEIDRSKDAELEIRVGEAA